MLRVSLREYMGLTSILTSEKEEIIMSLWLKGCLESLQAGVRNWAGWQASVEVRVIG